MFGTKGKLSRMINLSINITSICKPPNTVFLPPPIYSHHVIYSGDFNSRHKLWGYTNNDPNGAVLHDWASNNDLNLL